MVSPLLLAERLQHQVMGRGERLPERFTGGFLHSGAMGTALAEVNRPSWGLCVGTGAFSWQPPGLLPGYRGAQKLSRGDFIFIFIGLFLLTALSGFSSFSVFQQLREGRLGERFSPKAWL